MEMLFKIVYGLYIVSARDEKDNACVINTLLQQSSDPVKLSITVNKTNLTHDMILKTKKCAIAVLSEKTTFDTIKRFGLTAGRDVANKFEGIETIKTAYDLLLPKDGIIGYFVMDVIETVDVDSHTIFVGNIVEKVGINDDRPLSYDYYRANIKPKRVVQVAIDTWECRICGYIYDPAKGDPTANIKPGTSFEELPIDWICPICKHAKVDFVYIGNQASENVKTEEQKNKKEENLNTQALKAREQKIIYKGEYEMKKFRCTVCNYIHEGNDAPDICPVCKVKKDKFVEEVEVKAEEKRWSCTVCGYVHVAPTPPEKCPTCGAPASKFVELIGDMVWATEHVVGIAKDAPEDIKKDLQMNFTGECTEVGMYLAMARVAHRQGYPEIGLYYERAAWEEAEHAAKFAELLGEVVTDDTKTNLMMRVEAEYGACAGKMDLAARAKKLNLDAIHDTVHEMGKDEARHGKAFKGLLERYFK